MSRSSQSANPRAYENRAFSLRARNRRPSLIANAARSLHVRRPDCTAICKTWRSSATVLSRPPCASPDDTRWQADGAERHKRRGRVARHARERGVVAASIVAIAATRSSLARRSWRVRLSRSLRPRTCGEWDGMCSIPRCAKAQPSCVRRVSSTGRSPSACETPNARDRYTAPSAGRPAATRQRDSASPSAYSRSGRTQPTARVWSRHPTRESNTAAPPGRPRTRHAHCRQGAASRQSTPTARVAADGNPGAIFLYQPRVCNARLTKL
jgi:hypothetical protein